jgi:hypothetical protein
MAKNEEIGYWQLVSQGMDLEDRRLQMFVRHNASLGTGREAIVRKFLTEQTPEPYRVNTGFVVFPPDPDISSAQCDILVYDPRRSQPLYRIDEFVVVSPDTARLAIEVRSELGVSDDSGLDQVFHVQRSMRPAFGTQVFGFGFDGPLFGTFLGVAAKMNGDIQNIPECIVVSRRNYACIRVENFRAEPAERYFCLGMDFAEAGDKAIGFATALFLRCYQQRIDHNAHFSADVMAIVAPDMGVPHDKLKVIRPNGLIEDGYDRK